MPGESVALGYLSQAVRETQRPRNQRVSCFLSTSYSLSIHLPLARSLLGKKHTAEALVRQRLEEEPESPKLLCTLGDITGDLSLHEKAWEVSGGRFARAQRTLATR